MRANATLANFAGGELSPHLHARNDLDLYKTGLERAFNFFTTALGPSIYRAGFRMMHFTRNNQKGWLRKFQFNDQQTYWLEMTNEKIRFYKEDGVITQTPKNITGITQANPGVVTIAGHGWANGDEVFLENIIGMTELNGRSVVLSAVAANTFALKDVFGNNIDTTGYGAYVSGGAASRIYEIASPYTEAQIPYVQMTQNADTMYLTHKSHAPRKLTRTAHDNWTLATYARTNDPFTGAGNYPAAVAFTDDGRLVYGGTTNDPEKLFFSRAPDSSGTHYEDHTGGTNPTDAVVFRLAPVRGEVDAIRWITNTDRFLVVGTYSTVRRVFGATEEQSITANSITSRVTSGFGVDEARPASNGAEVYYIQRGRQILRSFEFDYRSDGYRTTDENLLADHLAYPGIFELADAQGQPDILWAARTDGMLLGVTYKNTEEITGWHRHALGGAHVNDFGTSVAFARVLSVGAMPRDNDNDQMWAVVERKIGGRTVRTVEQQTDRPHYPQFEDFYTGDETDDRRRYNNALYELQKQAVHLDMALSYDGSDNGAITIDPAAGATVQGNTGVQFVASGAFFTAGMVGRELWKKYDTTGGGGGQAVITGYTNSTTVTCTIKAAFDNADVVPAGDWFLTTDEVTGLWHMEGETVNVITDGGVHNTALVENARIQLETQASVVHVGYKYRGILKTLNIDAGSRTGSAQNKRRNMRECAIAFLNSGGASFGTDLYHLEPLEFRAGNDPMDRPVPLYTGVKIQSYRDSWEDEKRVFVVQDEPLPCTVMVIDAFVNTSDE